MDDLNNKTYGYSMTLNTWGIDELVADRAVIEPYLHPTSLITEEEISDLQKINSQFCFNRFDNFAYVGGY